MHSATWSPGWRPAARNSWLNRLAPASSSPNVSVVAAFGHDDGGIVGVLVDV